MARRNLTGNRIVVTGASSGIGRALALQLVERGAHVLATARRQDRLESLVREAMPFVEVDPKSQPGKDKGITSRQTEPSTDASSMLRSPSNLRGTIDVIAGDITDPAHRAALVAWVTQHWGGVDVLVNNAGAGAIGSFADASSDRLRRVMEVDFFAPAELTRLFLPLLEAGKRPAILNIGSVLGHRAVPNKSEYCAAKFAMRGWSEAIRVELAPRGVEVLLVSPSTTKSEFFESLVDTDPKAKSKSIGSMTPERVAQLAISALVRSKREMILSVGGRALVWFGRFFPNLTDRILGRFATEPEAKRR